MNGLIVIYTNFLWPEGSMGVWIQTVALDTTYYKESIG